MVVCEWFWLLCSVGFRWVVVMLMCRLNLWLVLKCCEWLMLVLIVLFWMVLMVSVVVFLFSGCLMMRLMRLVGVFVLVCMLELFLSILMVVLLVRFSEVLLLMGRLLWCRLKWLLRLKLCILSWF